MHSRYAYPICKSDMHIRCVFLICILVMHSRYALRDIQQNTQATAFALACLLGKWLSYAAPLHVKRRGFHHLPPAGPATAGLDALGDAAATQGCVWGKLRTQSLSMQPAGGPSASNLQQSLPAASRQPAGRPYKKAHSGRAGQLPLTRGGITSNVWKAFWALWILWQDSTPLATNSKHK